MQKIRNKMLDELIIIPNDFSEEKLSEFDRDDSSYSSDMKCDACSCFTPCSSFSSWSKEQCKNSDDEFIKNHSYCTLSGNSHHFSIIFRGNLSNKTPIKKILSRGENKFINNRSLHAEIDAIYKLNNLLKKKKNKIDSVNMLVIKVKRDGTISNSSPCINCLKKMTECPIGYKINKIYYSTNDQNINCEKLIDLINADKLHVSAYYRNTGYNINKWHHWRSKLNYSNMF
jgi:deoxycytidylate deaminase